MRLDRHFFVAREVDGRRHFSRERLREQRHSIGPPCEARAYNRTRQGSPPLGGRKRAICAGEHGRAREVDKDVRSWICTLAMAAMLLPAAPIAAAPDDAALQAGALLAEGHAEQAVAAVTACGEPRCRLVLGRALFALGRHGEAAAAVQGVLGSLGALEPHGLLLEGESLLLSGSAQAALPPLRQAAAGEGPVALRASALLADALLAAGDAPGAFEAAKRASALPGQPHDVQAAMAWDMAQALHAQPDRAREAAQALRNFWLQHPEHPAAENARALQRDLGIALPAPSGRELMLRASRLLAAGHPAAAVAQVQIAAGMLSGEDRAEAMLLHARALAADGRQIG